MLKLILVLAGLAAAVYVTYNFVLPALMTVGALLHERLRPREDHHA